jgi:hypothetical protein
MRLLDHWSPPDGAGEPVAVLATSFTFEADFFAQDCLARFLRLSTVVDDDAGPISSIAAILEEEDRLNEAQVTVLVDWSSPAEKRNLRWDVLPVKAPGGLLHAKVAILIWEHAARVIIGSANLTAAGYRRNIETAVVFDLRPDCGVPAPFVDSLSDELRRLVGLVPGADIGAKSRAQKTLDLLEARTAALGLPARNPTDLRLAIAAARPGTTPLDGFQQVWRGTQPLRATVLSPFWDQTTPSPALAAIRKCLTGRPADRHHTTVLVDVQGGQAHAPVSFLNEPDTSVLCFEPPDVEPRSLHAKVLLLESDEWLATMIGSSNATEAGLGLNPHHGHHELGVWIGCPANSKVAKQLRALVPAGDDLDSEVLEWEPLPDEEFPTTPVLHAGFLCCTVRAGVDPVAVIELVADALPDDWEIRLPAGRTILTASDWHAAGKPTTVTLALGDDPLPPYLEVTWSDAAGRCSATLASNVEDRAALPPPAELADLPVQVLLAALASSRPLPAALEHELRRHLEQVGPSIPVELDPLKRFDSSGLLLQRTRQLSLALWRLEQRLSRPASSIDVIRWRFNGAIGPIAIADGLLKAADEPNGVEGEAHFLLAELALTIANIDWATVGASLDRAEVKAEIAAVLAVLEVRRNLLPPLPDPNLDAYVDDAFAKVRS